ncbi:NACHT, LRR and PYD domains-containing protein 1a allele 5-like [Liolophura sinensis]|uniref:NACHT, LRR and PYD domains-containing protein 1a allele 5-like n=1 Tax=Liolophura sinensis TaxID=3198878 RepID=UPI003158E5D3
MCFFNSPHRPTTDIKTLKDLIEKMFEGESRTIAFVQGAAGTGKSTLCRKLAYLWATNDHHIYHRHLDLVLLVEALSVVSDNENPCYSIVRQLFPADFDLSEDDICKTIKKCGEKCLLIIDGVDELTQEGKSTVKELLRGGFLRHTNVVITGRPESVPEFIKDASFHFEITGFTKDNALEYVRKHFSDDECEQRDRLLEALEDGDEIVNFPANPLHLLLLCLLVQENVDTITFNSYKIVEQFIRFLCKGYLGKSDVEKNISETDLFRAACKIAKVGLEKNKLKFEESMIKEVLPGELGEHFLKSGVLTTDCTGSRLSTTIFWSFPHKSIQEYLSAVHLVTSDEDISHDFTQTVDHFYQLKGTFFMNLDLRQKQGLPIREQLSQALENVCPHYKKLKPGYQKYVGRVTCEKRNSEDGKFQDRVEMFQDILTSVFEMDQSVINTCISIIRENDDMLRSFITECRDDMASEFLQKIVPIPLTDDRDFETIRLWNFDVTYSVGHIDHREIVWPHFYDVYFDHSPVYTGEVPRHQRGSRLPWIHCNCLTDATFILPYDSPPVAVLSILLLPGMDDFQFAYKFSDYLKAVKKGLTLLLIAPNLQCEEDLSRVKLLRLINKCENPNVKIHFDWRVIPYQYFKEEKDENGHFKMTAEHRITKPVHHMYYDKYCPF